MLNGSAIVARFSWASAILAAVSLAGCASYKAPGRAAELAALTLEAQRAQTDPAVLPATERKPLASFPAGIAVVRLQAPGYKSPTAEGWGTGKYSIILTRDVEKDEQIETLAKMPGVRGLAPINRLLLPSHLESDVELRQAALRMQADMLLIYTLDTVFVVDENVQPLTIVSLGLFPNHKARVISTASAIVMDARSGYIYGVAESTDRQNQLASAWTSAEAVDQARRRAEANAFDKLCEQLHTTWSGIVEENAPRAQRQ